MRSIYGLVAFAAASVISGVASAVVGPTCTLSSPFGFNTSNSATCTSIDVSKDKQSFVSLSGAVWVAAQPLVSAAVTANWSAVAAFAGTLNDTSLHAWNGISGMAYSGSITAPPPSGTALPGSYFKGEVALFVKRVGTTVSVFANLAGQDYMYLYRNAAGRPAKTTLQPVMEPVQIVTRLVPVPVAGAGVPFLVGLMGFAIWRRRSVA